MDPGSSWLPFPKLWAEHWNSFLYRRLKKPCHGAFPPDDQFRVRNWQLLEHLREQLRYWYELWQGWVSEVANNGRYHVVDWKTNSTNQQYLICNKHCTYIDIIQILSQDLCWSNRVSTYVYTFKCFLLYNTVSAIHCFSCITSLSVKRSK